MKLMIFAAAAVAVSGGVAWAGGSSPQVDVPIWAYQSSANYCPAGLQPVSISGAICCGTPNRQGTYQAAKQHGGTYQRVTSTRKRVACPVGQKGCTTY